MPSRHSKVKDYSKIIEMNSEAQERPGCWPRRLRPKWTETGQLIASAERRRLAKRFADVEGAQKLRSLARQSRVLAAAAGDRQRATALQALARLYDGQAAELEAGETLSNDSLPWVEERASEQDERVEALIRY